MNETVPLATDSKSIYGFMLVLEKPYLFSLNSPLIGRRTQRKLTVIQHIYLFARGTVPFILFLYSTNSTQLATVVKLRLIIVSSSVN